MGFLLLLRGYDGVSIYEFINRFIWQRAQHVREKLGKDVYKVACVKHVDVKASPSRDSFRVGKARGKGAWKRRMEIRRLRARNRCIVWKLLYARDIWDWIFRW